MEIISSNICYCQFSKQVKPTVMQKAMKLLFLCMKQFWVESTRVKSLQDGLCIVLAWHGKGVHGTSISSVVGLDRRQQAGCVRTQINENTD